MQGGARPPPGGPETAGAAPETPRVSGSARTLAEPREAPSRRRRHRHRRRETPGASDGRGKARTLLRHGVSDIDQAVLRHGQARRARVLLCLRPRVQGRRDGLRRPTGASVRGPPGEDEGEGPEPGELRFLPQGISLRHAPARRLGIRARSVYPETTGPAEHPGGDPVPPRPGPARAVVVQSSWRSFL